MPAQPNQKRCSSPRYRSLSFQLLEARRVLSVWHNAIDQYDVDGDGVAGASDTLLLFNYLNVNGPGPVPADAPPGPPFFDIDNDDAVSQDDVDAIMNHINGKNNPPRGADRAVYVPRGGAAYRFAAADFGFSDPADQPQNDFVGVVITKVPAKTGLLYDGTALQDGDFVSADLIGKLTFAAPPGTPNGDYTSFTFQVKDSGGTANDGFDVDTTPNTLSIIVRNPWHNTARPLDVNDDGQVTTADADLVGDFLDANGPLPVPVDASLGPPFYDVDDDGFVGPADEQAIRSGFVLGGTIDATDEDGPRTIPAFATPILAQGSSYVVTPDQTTLFTPAGQPAISAAGTLTFTPAPNVQDVATVTVVLRDDVGASSPPQSFQIVITKARVWHNALLALDVTDSTGTGVDGQIAPGDTLTIINYLNAHPGDSAVPVDALPGPPYYDTSDGTGNLEGDGFVTPVDALVVINWINANGPGTSGSTGEGEAAFNQVAKRETLASDSDDHGSAFGAVGNLRVLENAAYGLASMFPETDARDPRQTVFGPLRSERKQDSAATFGPLLQAHVFADQEVGLGEADRCLSGEAERAVIRPLPDDIEAWAVGHDLAVLEHLASLPR